MSNRLFGVGQISVGWTGQVRSKVYVLLPSICPELNVKPPLLITGDTATDHAPNSLPTEAGVAAAKPSTAPGQWAVVPNTPGRTAAGRS